MRVESISNFMTAVNRSQSGTTAVNRRQGGTDWPQPGETGYESARLNIGLKSAETPVTRGLQALIYDILTGTFVPVKNR